MLIKRHFWWKIKQYCRGPTRQLKIILKHKLPMRPFFPCLFGCFYVLKLPKILKNKLEEFRYKNYEKMILIPFSLLCLNHLTLNLTLSFNATCCRSLSVIPFHKNIVTSLHVEDLREALHMFGMSKISRQRSVQMSPVSLQLKQLLHLKEPPLMYIKVKNKQS